MSNIGMMEGAFFVGRKEIVDWINVTLELNLSKIEQTASGAIACQLLDIMYPNQVPMHKVNWAAKQDFEFIQNYKTLQTCFDKLNIDKFVDVDRLIKAKYQDNLEFMQWFKRFFEMHVSGKGDYNAPEQRTKGKGGAQYNATFGRSSTVTAPSKPTSKVPTSKPTSETQKPKKEPSKTTTEKHASQHQPHTHSTQSENEKPNPNGANIHSHSSNGSSAEVAKLQVEIQNLKATNAELKADMEGLEKEKEFYFDKLREIEMLVQEIQDSGRGDELTSQICKILYATAEGFEAGDNALDEQPALEGELEDTY